MLVVNIRHLIKHVVGEFAKNFVLDANFALLRHHVGLQTRLVHLVGHIVVPVNVGLALDEFLMKVVHVSNGLFFLVDGAQQRRFRGLHVDVGLLHPVGQALRLVLEILEDAHDDLHLSPLFFNVVKDLVVVGDVFLDVIRNGLFHGLGRNVLLKDVAGLLNLLHENLPLSLFVEEVI